jgi:hypothetical protein
MSPDEALKLAQQHIALRGALVKTIGASGAPALVIAAVLASMLCEMYIRLFGKDNGRAETDRAIDCSFRAELRQLEEEWKTRRNQAN